jgi:FkbM family methyltransferase
MIKMLSKIYRWIFARHWLRKINMTLFQFSLRGLGILNFENDLVSGEQHFIQKVLPTIVYSELPVFIDVGANIGNYSASLLKRFPRAKVYAFEPHPDNFTRLNSRISSQRFRSYNSGLGELPKSLTLYDRADYNGSSHATLHRAVITEIHKQEVVAFDVQIETLDQFTENENINFIDFLKIDTEGTELSVLLGAKKLLKNQKIGCIQFEFNEMNIISRSFFRDFRKVLDNYNLYRLLPNSLLKLDDNPLLTEIYAYQNIVALPHKSK